MRKHKSNLQDLELIGVLRCDTKSLIHKRRKFTGYTSSKFKTFCSLTDTDRRMKRQARDWEKILQNIYLTKNLYPEFI